MRNLLSHECDFVAGGEGESIATDSVEIEKAENNGFDINDLVGIVKNLIGKIEDLVNEKKKDKKDHKK